MIYVGEADPVRRRLEQHQSGKDFWTWAVAFVSKDGSLNKAHVSYLESRLLTLAKEARRSRVENATGSGVPSLAEAERADADSFLADMLSIFPLLGLPVFERPRAGKRRARQLLFLRGKGLEGMAGAGHLRFAQDYAFNSPSTAAGVVLGRAANGRVEWQDAQGRTLKALQEAQVSSPTDGDDLVS